MSSREALVLFPIGCPEPSPPSNQGKQKPEGTGSPFLELGLDHHPDSSFYQEDSRKTEGPKSLNLLVNKEGGL